MTGSILSGRIRAMSIPMSTSKLLKRKQDLSILMHIPEALHKVLKMTSNAIHLEKVPIPIRITSSTKRRCVKPSEEDILIPLMSQCSLASAISRLSPSIIKMKSKGDKGQPCLIPREALKNFDGVPLIRTTKFAEVRQAIIQLTLRRGTPI